MSLLNGSHALELLGNLGESFLAGLTGHAGVHVRPLEVLAAGSSFQIRSRVLDGTALQQLEPHLSVLLLVGCRLLEDGSYLYVAVLLGLRSPVAVLVASHRLTCKSLLQVFLCLCSFQFFHNRVFV